MHCWYNKILFTNKYTITDFNILVLKLSAHTGLVFMVALGFLDCSQRIWGVVFMCLASGIFTFMRGGVAPNIPDIAPR